MRTVPIQGELEGKVIQALGLTPLFASVPPEGLQEIAARADLLQFDGGEVVVREGEPSDSFFVILSGEVRVLVGGADGAAVEVGVLKFPDSIGEMGLLLEKPRSATVLAKGGAALVKFGTQIFSHFFSKIPEFGLSISRFLAARVASASQQIPLSSTASAADVPPPEVLLLLPRELIERQRALPVKVDGHTLHLGVVLDPTPQLLTTVRAHLPGMEVVPARITQDYFDRCLASVAAVPGWPIAAAPSAAQPPPAGEARDLHRCPPELEALLRRMVAERASDLHLSGGQVPRWRIDGDMHGLADLPPLSSTQVLGLLDPVMRKSNRDEFARTNDTDFSYAIEGLSRFRVNLFRDNGGAGAVFRQIPDKILTLEQLNMPPVVQSVCNYPKGLVLVTGPTGSGKSTTLAAMIDYLNRTQKAHIITLEDPIEFVHKSNMALVNQREVGPHTDSFSRALRAALREDPDIVFVGEMRDLETVSMALETANTGHLVFGTLHTSTAISTVDRIVDLFPAAQQNQIRVVLADTLRAVVSQCLLRRIGGGRLAALEILISNPAVANLIREGKNNQIVSIMSTQRALGNRLLNDELAALVKDNMVEYEQTLSAALDKAGLAKLCNQPPPKV
ncbi:MAG: PilT/PilU family type 4a pilus ATPase [Deltaproteobacteria bacterium]|nr:PilT/PilU family type 4a pilus ATPase [Deltaproteobacteria bacterium]